MRLLNVRIAGEDERLVQDLRARGVSISNLVRSAIRAEAKQAQGAQARDPKAILAEMLLRFPTPAGPRRGKAASSSDRRHVKRIIRARLRRNA
jgi:hypothetical protein